MSDPRVYVSRVRGVLRVVDGDTWDLALDPGFHLTVTVRCRLLGYDCPEIKGPTTQEKVSAQAAREMARIYLSEGIVNGSLYARTEPDPDDFGRWLAHVWDNGVDLSLGGQLYANSLATLWPTRWREEYVKQDA